MSVIRSTAWSCLALVSMLLFAPTARADGDAEKEARRLFREGVALHQAHDYSGALAKFRKAYQSWKNPKILANIGTAAWELGQYPLAANSYDRFLAEAAADAPERAEVEKALKDVLPKVGTLEVRLTGTPRSVSIDGQPVDPKRLRRIRLAPGRHKVEAVAENGSSAEQSVKLEAGSTVIFSLSLETTKSQKPAFVAEEAPVDASPKPSRRRSAVPWIFGGIGVAGLATSAVFYSLRNSDEAELKNECVSSVCPASKSDKIDRANRFGTFSAIAFGIGVAGIGTATYFFLNPPGAEAEAPQQALELRIRTSPEAADVTLGGRF